MKKCLLLVFALALILTLFGCGKELPAELHLADFDLSGVDQIRLQNAHNGQYTILLEQDDIAEITVFIQDFVGTSPESGKGYYEGTYAVQFYRDDENVFSMAFGDSDCFYTGKGGDGYPLRYLLPKQTILEKVIPFFSRYDQSGFVWN